MKKLFMLLLAAMLLTACGRTEEPEKVPTSKEETSKQDEVKKEEAAKPKVSETKVSFLNFTVEVKDVKLKGNKLTLDTLYTNDSFPGEKAFMAAAGLDVKQSGELLEEVSGVTQDPKGNYYYKNKVGIWAPVEFEYELLNDTDDVEITIVPRDGEEPKTITVTLNE